MRLATFNILHGRSPVDDLVDLDRYVDAVAALDADVLALQEVDRHQPRSQHADLTALAAEAMGAPEHRFVAALSGTPGAVWTAADGREQPDAAAYGVALLSRHPVLSWEVVRLAPVPVPVPMSFPGQRLPTLVRDEPRVAVAATVDGPRGTFTVVNTHLTFVSWWHRRQLRHLRRAVAGCATPLFLVGDLNMEPEPAERLSGLGSLVDAQTFPAETPDRQLDHMLATEDVSVQDGRGEARHLPLSDHRALVWDWHPEGGH